MLPYSITTVPNLEVQFFLKSCLVLSDGLHRFLCHSSFLAVWTPLQRRIYSLHVVKPSSDVSRVEVDNSGFPLRLELLH
jgi:hypothetical protein